ncbi:hypothetical protein [Nocardia sp. NPDC050710]|uniref:hypothetical protein n=1 Tax=Nocardia sp. NPDC050710 TaxID=3157220 RepID=UPI0033EB95A1
MTPDVAILLGLAAVALAVNTAIGLTAPRPRPSKPGGGSPQGAAEFAAEQER